MDKIGRTMWERHAHPLSGWTRSLTQPLVFVPFWTRSWKQGVAIAAWFAINPVLFPSPKDDRAWMTRGIRGEELWIANLKRQLKAHHIPITDIALWLDIVGSGLFLDAMRQAWRRRALAVGIRSAIVFAINLWYLDLMGKFYDAHTQVLTDSPRER